jgi:hypothetical protein
MEAFKPGTRSALEYKEHIWFFLTNILNQCNGVPSYLSEIKENKNLKKEMRKFIKKGEKDEMNETENSVYF